MEGRKCTDTSCSDSCDRTGGDLFRLRSSSSTSTDIPISSEIRVNVSRPVKHDLNSLITTLSRFGEVQHVDVSRMQFDSSFSISFFDIRASVVAKNHILLGKCAGLSIESRTRFGSACTSVHCSTLSARSIDVIGFETPSALECHELMLSVFGRFGEVESINMASDGRFTLVFFDTRAALAVQSALTSSNGEKDPLFTEHVVVSADQLLHLLLIGNTISGDIDVSPPSLVRSPPSKEFNRTKSSTSTEFSINLRSIEKGFDARTTVMIRNIPKSFSQTFFLSILNARFPDGTFNFVYLPMDLMNGVNVGYAFINFHNSKTIIPFYNFFNSKTWKLILHTLDIQGARAFEPDISNRTCKVTFARIQGMEQLCEHFRSSSIMNQPDSIRPYFYTDSE
jgi:hypothetical protein